MTNGRIVIGELLTINFRQNKAPVLGAEAMN